MFFSIDVSTVNVLNYTPFAYVSIFSPIRAVVPWFCHNKRKISLSQFCI